MRELTDHIVEQDSVNHHLVVRVLDNPGEGGACHVYEIDLDHGRDGMEVFPIRFQLGLVAETDVNGVTQEALLAIVIDRLRGFQTGRYACRENAIALTHFEEGLMWLQRRTRLRIARGVEGTREI